MGYYNHYPYQLGFGKIYQWILWKAFPNLRVIVILVIVDKLTKFAHFIPMKHPYIAAIVAQLFLDNIVKLHGIPSSIVSNSDKIFVSTFWQHLFKLYKVKLILSSA
jgi:hypothetical protein